MDEPISIHAGKTHLSRLIARAEAGEEIVIAGGHKPVVKLVAIAAKPKRVLAR
jgi:antitoxin (DNA-binding transcriptional repressor) of toxin-antitoxin stability system